MQVHFKLLSVQRVRTGSYAHSPVIKGILIQNIMKKKRFKMWVDEHILSQIAMEPLSRVVYCYCFLY